MVDAEGVDALTMRGLARALGVAPMSLYRHVRDKEELLDLLVEELAERLPTPCPTESWQQTLLTVMRSVRRLLVDHPGLAQLLTSRMFRLPSVVQAIDLSLGALRRAGLGEREAARIVPALWMLTFGLTVTEQSLAGRREDETSEQFRQRFALEVRDGAAGPSAVAVAAGTWAEFDEDEVFEQALALLLAGIAARAAGSEPA
jgi:TetR/AcrR family transcriptional regulator, tetracycline repressor protein